MKKTKITKDSLIGEILSDKPELADKLADYGFHCLGCPMSRMETLEQAAETHGMNKKKVAKLIDDLNG